MFPSCTTMRRDAAHASDQRLVEAVHAGSERAFEALFDRHHAAVLAFCRRMLGSVEEAEDAAQLTFLAAYRDLERSVSPQALRPWLYGIARHRCLSMLRARRERPMGEPPELAGDHLGVQVARREEVRGVFADLARLPEQQRVALILAELGDVSHADIARILACPRAKVKALVFQARSSLAVGREARETPCAVIREQLSTLRGGALRRAALRRHVRDCPACRAFRERLRGQRRWLGLLLPVMPGLGLKRAVFGGLLGSGGGAGGAAVAAVLVTAAIPLGGMTAVLNERDEGRVATVEARSTERAAGPASARPADVRLGRPVPTASRAREQRARPASREPARRPAKADAHAKRPDAVAAPGPSSAARPDDSARPTEHAPAARPPRQSAAATPAAPSARGSTARTPKQGNDARPPRASKADRVARAIRPSDTGAGRPSDAGQAARHGKPPQSADPVTPQSADEAKPPQAADVPQSQAADQPQAPQAADAAAQTSRATSDAPDHRPR
jgi:RNA polymerase sigma factor (sigma-70 family)